MYVWGTCVYIYIYMYVCVCICICSFIRLGLSNCKETHGETHTCTHTFTQLNTIMYHPYLHLERNATPIELGTERAIESII